MDKDESQQTRKWWITVTKQLVRLVILLVVAWCVWRTVAQASREIASEEFALSDLSPGWMALAGTFYLVGLLPCWFFWHRTLWAMDQRPQWRDSLPAFWIGHLGKYVPGKAMVVVLRTGLVHGPRVNKTVAATSVFVETLTMMAVGAFLSAVILLFTSSHWTLMLLAVGLMIGSGLPTLPPLFRRIVRLLQVRRANPEIDNAIAGVNYRLMGIGWIVISLGWVFLGSSLWATIQAMPVNLPADNSLTAVPLLTAAVGLAMVAGFLSLIPGGLGVRDSILMTLLAPHYGPTVAVISAVVLRVVWLLTELLVSGVLYLLRRR